MSRTVGADLLSYRPKKKSPTLSSPLFSPATTFTLGLQARWRYPHVQSKSNISIFIASIKAM